MNIGLWSDSYNFPSLPLMKISAWHKAQGDAVELWQPSKRYDVVFASKVFTESIIPIFSNTDQIITGGSGIDLNTKLPSLIEHIYPDYGLYPEYYFALGFLTRGCPYTNHPYCITPKKDGCQSVKVADISAFWREQKNIVLQNKVNDLEALQSNMKNANVYYRKNKTMRGYAKLSDKEADEMNSDIVTYGCPYPQFTLTNNNAKLKAAKDRLARLSRVKAQDNTEIAHEHFKVVRNTEIMRLQLIFDGKPSEQIRTILKSNGFVWSGKNMAWQRQLTNNAIDAYRDIVKQLDALPKTIAASALNKKG